MWARAGKQVNKAIGDPGSLDPFHSATSVERPPFACLFGYCHKMAAALLVREEYTKSKLQKGTPAKSIVSFRSLILNLNE